NDVGASLPGTSELAASNCGDGSSTPRSRRRRSNAPRSAIPLAELTRKLDAVPEGPQVMLKLAILDVPDFYSALTNHTGCRRPLAHPPVGRTGVCYFWTPVHGHWLGWPLHGRRRNRLRR